MNFQETAPIRKFNTFRLENKRSIKLIGGGGGGGEGVLDSILVET